MRERQEETGGEKKGMEKAGSRHKGDYRRGICSYTEKARNCPHNEPGG